jgi:hypothetical protein
MVEAEHGRRRFPIFDVALGAVPSAGKQAGGIRIRIRIRIKIRIKIKIKIKIKIRRDYPNK